MPPELQERLGPSVMQGVGWDQSLRKSQMALQANAMRGCSQRKLRPTQGHMNRSKTESPEHVMFLQSLVY